MNLVTSVGFQSITSAIRLLERVRDVLRKVGPGVAVRVFYVSDFDPAGDGMPVAVARQLEFYAKQHAPGADIKLTPIALTREQVIRHRLPRIPIKDEDLRKGRFEDRYGEGAVELDALEALRPGALARIVRRAAQPYRDTGLEQRMDEAGEEARETAEEAWDDAIAEQRQQLEALEERAREIVGPYQAELEQLAQRLDADLGPLNGELEAIRQAVLERAEDFDVDLPDRPEAEIDEVDESDWLFDSRRDYMGQLAAYKARQGNLEEQE
jgi:hypothetical protein